MFPTLARPVHGMLGLSSDAFAASSTFGVGVKGFQSGGGRCATAAAAAEDGGFLGEAAASASFAHWPLWTFQSVSEKRIASVRCRGGVAIYGTSSLLGVWTNVSTVGRRRTGLLALAAAVVAHFTAMQGGDPKLR